MGSLQDVHLDLYLRLSDAFMTENNGEKKRGCLECEVRMLNINYGHNKELMEKSQRLKEYAIFVDKLRKYAKEFPNRLELAITKAIDDSPKGNIFYDRSLLCHQMKPALSG